MAIINHISKEIATKLCQKQLNKKGKVIEETKLADISTFAIFFNEINVSAFTFSLQVVSSTCLLFTT